MVGRTGFEPATSRLSAECPTRLGHRPTGCTRLRVVFFVYMGFADAVIW
jgi:hypothetical protein